MSSGVGKGKGSLLIHSRDYIVAGRGRAVWDELVAESAPRDREVLNGIFLAGAWYPIGVINRVVQRYCTTHYDGSPEEEMRKLSSYIADTDLGSVYKMVLRLGSPEFLVRRTGSLWNRYFDTGVLTPTESSNRQWNLVLDMDTGEEAAPNQFFCGPGCPAWIEMGLRLTGAPAPMVEHVECRYDNGQRCRYWITW